MIELARHGVPAQSLLGVPTPGNKLNDAVRPGGPIQPLPIRFENCPCVGPSDLSVWLDTPTGLNSPWNNSAGPPGLIPVKRRSFVCINFRQ